MCGIIGYTGEKRAAPILIEGLKRLEYRGYDSAGIAVIEDDKIKIEKYKGNLKVLDEKTKSGENFNGTLGIAHTRWATHGKPSDENSHPHYSYKKRFAVVHNGIIENYIEIKQFLQEKNIVFSSETDTEVISHLLEFYYDKNNAEINADNSSVDFDSLLDIVSKTASRLEGSFALGLISSEHPDKIIAVKKSSPLIIGIVGEGKPDGEIFIASDVTAFLNHTREIYRLDDGEIAVCGKGKVSFYTSDKTPLEKKTETITWDIKAAEKGGYEHFMYKEIMEQPEALNATISPRISPDGEIVLDGIKITESDLRKVQRINIVACGSAYHAGIVGKYVIEKITRIPVIVDIASEFRYQSPIIDENSLVIIISQSGETADTLAALREAKNKKARVLSVINVVGSTIANESDDVLYTWAGPEISVATTKGYSTQTAMLYIIALYIAKTLKTIPDEEIRLITSSLLSIHEKVREIAGNFCEIKEIAKKYSGTDHAYFIGRNMDYAVALEASLKLKEISYIHSEAYAAGELKHGTISLIEDNTFVVALSTAQRLYDKTMSNIKEVRARGADILFVTTRQDDEFLEDVDHVVRLPQIHELLMPSLAVVPMQLLGYYMAKERGCDIDKPRNLAKSVTVE